MQDLAYAKYVPTSELYLKFQKTILNPKIYKNVNFHKY